MISAKFAGNTVRVRRLTASITRNQMLGPHAIGSQISFEDSADRCIQPISFIYFYNTKVS